MTMLMFHLSSSHLLLHLIPSPLILLSHSPSLLPLPFFSISLLIPLFLSLLPCPIPLPSPPLLPLTHPSTPLLLSFLSSFPLSLSLLLSLSALPISCSPSPTLSIPYPLLSTPLHSLHSSLSLCRVMRPSAISLLFYSLAECEAEIFMNVYIRVHARSLNCLCLYYCGSQWYIQQRHNERSMSAEAI